LQPVSNRPLKPLNRSWRENARYPLDRHANLLNHGKCFYTRSAKWFCHLQLNWLIASLKWVQPVFEVRKTGIWPGRISTDVERPPRQRTIGASARFRDDPISAQAFLQSLPSGRSRFCSRGPDPLLVSGRPSHLPTSGALSAAFDRNFSISRRSSRFSTRRLAHELLVPATDCSSPALSNFRALNRRSSRSSSGFKSKRPCDLLGPFAVGPLPGEISCGPGTSANSRGFERKGLNRSKISGLGFGKHAPRSPSWKRRADQSADHSAPRRLRCSAG